jgi:hypothetical protein
VVEIVKQLFADAIKVARTLIGAVDKVSAGRLSKSDIDVRGVLVVIHAVTEVGLDDHFQPEVSWCAVRDQ